MRVSDSQVFFSALNGIIRQQSEIARYQAQISSGKRLTEPADDPVAAARILGIGDRVAAVEQFDRNADFATLRLSQQETALATGNDAVQRIRELIVRAKTTSLNADDRRFIAAEIRQRYDELVDVGNTRNASGEYIFAGSRVTTQPFTQQLDSSVVYNGDQAEREVAISEGRTVTEGFSGHDVFMAIRNGNGIFVSGLAAGNSGSGRVIDQGVVDPALYQAHDFRIRFTAPDTYDVIDDTTATTVLAAQPFAEGATIAFNGVHVSIAGQPAAGDEFTVQPAAAQSLFATVAGAIAALENPQSTPAQEARFQFDLDRVLGDLDQGLDRLREVTASIGARRNAIDAQRTANEELVLQLQGVRADLEDADIVEAVSRLARETTALQAAQQAFVRTRELSLFNYL